MAHDQKQSSVEFKRKVEYQFGQKYLSLVYNMHDVLVLFMFSLIADQTIVGCKLLHTLLHTKQRIKSFENEL